MTRVVKPTSWGNITTFPIGNWNSYYISALVDFMLSLVAWYNKFKIIPILITFNSTHYLRRFVIQLSFKHVLTKNVTRVSIIKINIFTQLLIWIIRVYVTIYKDEITYLAVFTRTVIRTWFVYYIMSFYRKSIISFISEQNEFSRWCNLSWCLFRVLYYYKPLPIGIKCRKISLPKENFFKVSPFFSILKKSKTTVLYNEEEAIFIFSFLLGRKIFFEKTFILVHEIWILPTYIFIL